MSAHTLNLSAELYAYLQKISLREAPILRQLRLETQKLSGGVMQISPEQGQFMALLTELIGAKKVIDIGTFTGYSALVVALALPVDGELISCDVDVASTNIARKYWEEAGVIDKISLHIAKAAETLQHLIDKGQKGTFDLVFIDADKTNYDVYYELGLTLTRPGGLILIDNVLWNGRVADENDSEPSTRALRALNAKLLKDDRVRISMLPVGDGLTLALKR